MINIQFPIQNLGIHFQHLMFTSIILNQEKLLVYHVQLNIKICKKKLFSLFFKSLFWFFRKSDCYIYHVVWYCDTCLSIVYGNRAQNSSIIQLYDIQPGINNDNIVLKSRYTEETRKGGLLPRFLKPVFSPLGLYAFIIRYDSTNSDKPTYKAHPHIARIHFDQTVCCKYCFKELFYSAFLFVF